MNVQWVRRGFNGLDLYASFKNVFNHCTIVISEVLKENFDLRG